MNGDEEDSGHRDHWKSNRKQETLEEHSSCPYRATCWVIIKNCLVIIKDCLFLDSNADSYLASSLLFSQSVSLTQYIFLSAYNNHLLEVVVIGDE